MASLAQLIAHVRNLIGDLSVDPFFEDAEIQDFINFAIADISQHFPLQTAYAITTEAGEHSYDLELAHRQIFSVEYPTGSTPPTYLARRRYTEPNFWLSTRFYDVIITDDATSENPPRLLISASPAADEIITIQLTAEHNPLLASNDVTTIPDRHIHLIGLFCRWKIWQQISIEEAMDPNPLLTYVQTQELNAGRAEEAYRNAVQAAHAAASASATAQWKMDRHDRVY